MTTSAKSLRQIDEVKTFASIEMPTPLMPAQTAPSREKGRTNHTKREISSEESKMKKSSKISAGIQGVKPPRVEKVSKNSAVVFTGFTPSNLRLDGDDSSVSSSKATTFEDLKKPVVSTVVIDSGNIPETGETQLSNITSFVKNQYKSDPTMEELRNYLILMDQYSIHNFIVYQGHALRDTPEFQSFRRTYLHAWGAISYIIEQIESFLAKFEIKLAVVDGPKVYELSTLNLSYFDREDLLSCIANEEQIKPYLNSLNNACSNQQLRAAIIVQTLVRRFLAKRQVGKIRCETKAAIRIQSYARLFLYRMLERHRYRLDTDKLESRREYHRNRLREWWKKAPVYASNFTGTASSTSFLELPDINNRQGGPSTEMGPSTSFAGTALNERSRLLLYVPSVACPEYLRLEMENFNAIENSHISLLYQLIDPDVHILYVTPFLFGPSEISYHEKLLAILGISTLPKRLHFIYPEMCTQLPLHLPLSLMLYCSSVALKKIKLHINRSSHCVFIPTSVGWAEKRVADLLDIPILAPDASVALSLQSRSFTKKIFMDASMNIPLGSHDISNMDDMFIALSRLIATNLDVNRWIIRLNYDYNNESTVFLDAEKFPVIAALRNEQQLLLEMSNNNPAAWFERPIQLSSRKRVLDALKKDFVHKITICRRDIYGSWDYYLKLMNMYGALVEAEPLETLGYVDSLFFIDPFGEINTITSVELCIDDRYQNTSYIYPQSVAPKPAVDGATRAIAKVLLKKHPLSGYFSVRFVSFWDSLDQIPRMWAIGLSCGFSPAFAALGVTSILTHSRPTSVLTKSLLPAIADIPIGRHVVYIPITIHSPLRGTRDDIFFKLCKMRGVTYDAESKVGTLFFLVDAVVGGAVSLFCIGKTRKRALEVAVHVLTFISQNFGKPEADERQSAEQLLNIYLKLRQVLRREDKEKERDKEREKEKEQT